jgi:hypothetical protein
MSELGITDSGAEFSAPALSLGADVLELGIGDGMFFREFREHVVKDSRMQFGN